MALMSVAKLGGKMRKSLIRQVRNGLQSRLRRFDSDPSLHGRPLTFTIFHPRPASAERAVGAWSLSERR
jgi:hypothetical protein